MPKEKFIAALKEAHKARLTARELTNQVYALSVDAVNGDPSQRKTRDDRSLNVEQAILQYIDSLDAEPEYSAEDIWKDIEKNEILRSFFHV